MVLASAIFSPQWSGKVIQIKTDNAAVIQVIETTRAQNAHLMYLLRLFFTSYYDLWFTASHIAISLNTSADALSRNNMAVFFLQVPHTCPVLPHTISCILRISTLSLIIPYILRISLVRVKTSQSNSGYQYYSLGSPQMAVWPRHLNP